MSHGFARSGVISAGGKLFTITVPPAAGWTDVNLGSSVFAVTDGIHYLSAEPGAGAWSMRGRERACPSTPYQINALMTGNFWTLDYLICGLFFRGAGGEMHTLGAQYNSGYGPGLIQLVEELASPTSWTSTLDLSSGELQIRWANVFGFHIKDDGTDRSYGLSANGDPDQVRWVYTHARTTYFTPATIGWFAAAYTGSDYFHVSLPHWEAS